MEERPTIKPSSPSMADRDPNLMQWKFVTEFLNPEKIDMLTELNDQEIKTIAKYKGFVKFMKTPLFVDYEYSTDAITTYPQGSIVKLKSSNGDVNVWRVWSDPVAFEEAVYWLKLLRVSKDRKRVAELLKAIGRTIVNYGSGAFGLGNDKDPIPGSQPWYKFW